jgi:hypothetical protein
MNQITLSIGEEVEWNKPSKAVYANIGAGKHSQAFSISHCRTPKVHVRVCHGQSFVFPHFEFISMVLSTTMTTMQIKLLRSQGTEDDCQHASYVLKTSRLRTKSGNDEEHGSERDEYAALCVIILRPHDCVNCL